MANEEHLAILKQGVEAWNKWRSDHTDVRPNLDGADLNEAELNGVNLRQVDLRGAVAADLRDGHFGPNRGCARDHNHDRDSGAGPSSDSQGPHIDSTPGRSTG